MDFVMHHTVRLATKILALALVLVVAAAVSGDPGPIAYKAMGKLSKVRIRNHNDRASSRREGRSSRKLEQLRQQRLDREMDDLDKRMAPKVVGLEKLKYILSFPDHLFAMPQQTTFMEPILVDAFKAIGFDLTWNCQTSITKESFNQFDVDNNGLLDASEIRYLTQLTDNVDALRLKLDSDQDGYVTPEEAVAASPFNSFCKTVCVVIVESALGRRRTSVRLISLPALRCGTEDGRSHTPNASSRHSRTQTQTKRGSMQTCVCDRYNVVNHLLMDRSSS